jgi:hypothetical protein
VVDKPLGFTVPFNVAPVFDKFVTGLIWLSGSSFLQPVVTNNRIAVKIIGLIQYIFFMIPDFNEFK